MRFIISLVVIVGAPWILASKGLSWGWMLPIVAVVLLLNTITEVGEEEDTWKDR